MSDRGRSRSPDRDGGRDGGDFGGENGGRVADDHEGKLFLKNLSWHIREDDLKDEFGKFGPIAEIKLPTDFSGRIKGFGFITFENPNDAKVAKEELHDKEIMGRPIYVDFSAPQDQRPRTERPPFQPRGPRSNVCYAWQRGECTRGRDCRFDHFEGGRGGSDDRRGSYDDRRGGYDDRRGGYDDRRGGGRDYDRRDRHDDRRGGGGGRDRDRDYDRRDRDYDRRDRSRSRDRGGRGDRY